MAVFQDVDKCMRCNGCVSACKREWNLKMPTSIADVKPQRSLVGPRQRLAIKSVRRGDMGPFLRYTCWHCPSPPCASACPLKAIKKQATGAVSIDNAICNPTVCKTGPGPKPCELGCQRGGYPKVGLAYESGPYSAVPRANKCTLCHGRAGADGVVDASTALPTRARKVGSDFVSDLPLSSGTLPFPTVPELAHEPACVSTCPAKAMKWDARDNILAYLNDTANGYVLADGTRNWIGNGSLFWASKKMLLVPPKADPFVEDHIAPMTASLLSSGKLLIPTAIVAGLAALSARKVMVEKETSALTGEEG
jgi:Fe-S-cluster-containing dehydrogenase component